MINEEFFEQTPNHVADYIDLDPKLEGSLRLIQVNEFRPEHRIRILMNDDDSRAIGYLVPEHSD
jgi:hypothetical protein